MTKQPSQPSSKPISPTGGDKAEEKDAEKNEPMGRFRALTKQVVATPVDRVRALEKRERASRQPKEKN